ncbi:MAG: hypothetical protein QNJ44_14380 [Rhodobacter sp.]|nr:hypothetical protein [Rhodobacter sp.]
MGPVASHEWQAKSGASSHQSHLDKVDGAARRVLPALGFVLYATVLTLLPVSFLPALHGADSAFWLLSGDAYLYLGIGESSTAEFFSFDGEKPTNGFHPLWQFYVWTIAKISAGNAIVLMNTVAWSSVILCLAGVLLLGSAVHRATGSWLPAMTVVPGVYYLVVGQGLQNLAVWNHFSGMEDGLVLMLTGLVAFLISGFDPDDRRPRPWLALGTVLALLMLARLDEIFVSASIGLALLFWAPGLIRRRFPMVVLLGLPSAIALGCYLTYNWSYAGVLMPISGAAKGEGALLQNLYVTLVDFLAPTFDLREALTDYSGDRTILMLGTFRVAELVFPAVLAGFFVAIIRRHFRAEPWAPFAAGLCIAIIIKALYDFAFVNYWHQAPWYFSFASGTISFVTALMIAPFLARLRTNARQVVWMLVTLLVLVGSIQASMTYARNAQSIEAVDRLAFWQARKEIETNLLAARPDAKILEFGDGMLNFAFDMPVRHGFVFAGDADSLSALQNKNLLQASFADGYTLLASYEYMRWPGASTNSTSDEIRNFLKNSLLEDRIQIELDQFEFRIAYVYEPLKLPFFLFTPHS